MTQRCTSLPFIFLAAAACADVPSGPYARARVIGGLDEAIGGEMGAARPGDFVVENDRFRVGILGGRNSLGPGLYGGSLVDADLQWNDPSVDGGQGRDAWNEMFPLVSMNVPLASDEELEDTASPAQNGSGPSVRIVKDGADGGDAVVRVQAPGAPFLTLLDLLWPIVGMPDMWTVTDYIAKPGEPWLNIKTTTTFQSDEVKTDGTPMEYPEGGLAVIDVGLLEGIVGGDFFLAGGSLDVFAPGIGFDEDGAVFERVEAGDNIFADPFEFPFVAAVGDGISYGIAPIAGNMYVPLFTASQTAVVGGLAPGRAPDAEPCPNGATGDGRFCIDDAFTYERYFFIGHGDVGSVLDQYLEARDIPYGRIEGRVVEEGSADPLSHVDVFAFRPGEAFPYAQWRTDVRPDDSVPDGSFAGRLPVGDWELVVHEQGRPDTERLPITITACDDDATCDRVNVRLEALRAGTVSFRIVDESGRNVPAKLTVFREDKSQPSTRVPAFGDGFIAGDPEWVFFADQGEGEVALPPGRYLAVASRGIEYELDRSDVFEVSATKRSHLELKVTRSIDTAGWIGADFHVHSAPSHDSGVSLENRVRSMVCEGVEFMAATDHDAITDFAPVVERMGLERWLQTAPGVETTTIEIGHYLAFPLQQDFLGDNGGAMDWTGHTPQMILDELRKQGEAAGFDPLVFVAHPRDGILGYFDQFGFDPFAGTPAADGSPPIPDYDPSFGGLPNPNELIAEPNFVMDMDALELFTGKRFDTHRTATVDEVLAYNKGEDDGVSSVYPWIERTMAEQTALIEDAAKPFGDGVVRLNADLEGVVDDWFTLLNLGYRITAIGNSDTHGLTSIEAGCPRNYVLSNTDSPGFIDDQEVADAVKDHRVVASFGPFLRMWIDGKEIGSSLKSDGTVEVQIEVQAPSWVDVDRVEFYENGTLVKEFLVDEDMPSNLRFFETFEHTVEKDAWYVAIAMGDGTLAPVFTEVEIPYIPLDEAVIGALDGVPLVGGIVGGAPKFPTVHPVHPYAITNPIWVDRDGGGWQAPGHPDWLVGAEVDLGE